MVFKRRIWRVWQKYIFSRYWKINGRHLITQIIYTNQSTYLHQKTPKFTRTSNLHGLSMVILLFIFFSWQGSMVILYSIMWECKKLNYIMSSLSLMFVIDWSFKLFWLHMSLLSVKFVIDRSFELFWSQVSHLSL